MEKVDRSGDCWIWTAYRDPQGYGKFSIDGRIFLAHRVSYQMLVGPIPDGLTIDHLCRTPACVNPDHLEPVTIAENLGRKPERTHCPAGHELTPENSWLTSHTTPGRVRPTRKCRTCDRDRKLRPAQAHTEMAS